MNGTMLVEEVRVIHLKQKEVGVAIKPTVEGGKGVVR
jgi:hypothetical protein